MMMMMRLEQKKSLYHMMKINKKKKNYTTKCNEMDAPALLQLLNLFWVGFGKCDFHVICKIKSLSVFGFDME